MIQCYKNMLLLVVDRRFQKEWRGKRKIVLGSLPYLGDKGSSQPKHKMSYKMLCPWGTAAAPAHLEG